MQRKIANNLGLALSARKVTFGTDNIINAMRNKKMALVVMSTTASFNTQKLIQDKASTNGVRVVFVNEIDELTISKALGKNNVKVLGITDFGFAKLIIKNIKE